MTLEYVEFPALGLRVPVLRTLFRPFGQDIYTYAVIIALSVVLMIILGLRHADRYGIGQDFIIDFMIFALPASIICARLYYVVFSWDNYKNNLLSILNIRQGGIALYGSVIGAFITVLIFSKARKMDALQFFDFGVPYLLLAQGIGRWGNFVNQEVFGANTSLPWCMTSDQITAYLVSNAQRLADLGIIVDPMKPVHPTFLYESIWNILVACVLFWLRRRRKYKGETLLGYLIGYGAGRAFIEGLRTDSLMLGNFRISQLISVLIVVICLLIIVFFRGKFKLYEGLATDTGNVSEANGDVDTTDGSEGAEDSVVAEDSDVCDLNGEEDSDAGEFSEAENAGDDIDDNDNDVMKEINAKDDGEISADDGEIKNDIHRDSIEAGDGKSDEIDESAWSDIISGTHKDKME